MDHVESCCSSCQFWSQQNEAQGECRVKPPIAIAVPQVDLSGQTRLGVTTIFPVTAVNCWCGEHPKRAQEYEDALNKMFDEV